MAEQANDRTAGSVRIQPRRTGRDTSETVKSAPSSNFVAFVVCEIRIPSTGEGREPEEPEMGRTGVWLAEAGFDAANFALLDS